MKIKKDFKTDGTGMQILKVDEDKRMVFGFFSVTKIDGEYLFDLQDDAITTEVLEKAVYEYVLDARDAGEMHVKTGVGQLVESFMITKEKVDVILKTLTDQGIPAVMDLGVEGWFGGFYISDDDVWDKVKKGEYPMFSIGGSGQRIPVEE